MPAFYEELSEVVRRYLSPVNAQAILGQVISECRKTPVTLGRGDVPVFWPKLERAIALFLEPGRRAALRADVEALNGGANSASMRAALRSHVIPMRVERDISDARLTARQLCVDLHARPLQIQKVAMAVSELARNIVSYTPGGQIELTPQAERPSSVTILST